MAKYGLLIDYDYCTGCHSCEIACQQEHNFPAGKNGIIVTEHIYETYTKICIDNLPFPTDLCDLCINLHKEGEEPACVKHCQSKCMQFGFIDKLVKEMEKRPKMVLFTPR
ncbi:MAG: 4Fe-4S binding protein [Deltaproteobacteria bacterium]|nr:4Fe-4S binding protein [Deltaproteobacteria bacterium]